MSPTIAERRQTAYFAGFSDGKAQQRHHEHRAGPETQEAYRLGLREGHDQALRDHLVTELGAVRVYE